MKFFEAKKLSTECSVDLTIQFNAILNRLNEYHPQNR